MAQLCKRAKAQNPAAPTLAELFQSISSVVASAGGQASAPIFSFHLNVCFIRHCLLAYPSLMDNAAAVREWYALMIKAGNTAQRSAMVAISQHLDRPCGGLGVWRPGMLKGRASPAKKTRASTKRTRPIAE